MGLNITISSADWVDLRYRGYGPGIYIHNPVGSPLEYSTSAVAGATSSTIVGADAVLCTSAYLWMRGYGDCELLTAAEWDARRLGTSTLQVTSVGSTGAAILQDGSLDVSGTVHQVLPDYQTVPELIGGLGGLLELAPGDFITSTKISNGQTVLALSGGPLTHGESRVTLAHAAQQPCALEIEASVVRNRQQFVTAALFDNAGAIDPVPEPINIVSIYQSSAGQGAAYNSTAGTTCTIVLETALPAPGTPGAVYLSDWVHIVGLVDTRLNYQNACISFISPDRKTLTVGFSDELVLPSVAIAPVTPVAGSARVHFYNNLGGAQNGFGIRFTGTTATSAALVSVFGGGDAQVSGTLLGDHRTTVSSSAPVYLNGVFGNYELKATTRYRLEGRPNDCSFLDKPADTVGVATNRYARTAVKPAAQSKLQPRLRLYQPVGMTRPVAKIISAVKTGTTTTTINHDGAYNFTTGQYVTIKGIRDVVNFAPMTTAVAITVLSPTQFTCVMGTAVTATSYGGAVVLCNGSVDQPGIVGQVVQTVQSGVAGTIQAPGWLNLSGSAAWVGVNVGDYVNLYGVRADLTGANIGVDGAWEVAHLSTTTMTLKPVYDIFGNRVSPELGTLGLTNASGAVIIRTTLRAHDVLLESWSEVRTMLDGQGTVRVDKAIPVYPVATQTVAGTATVDAALPVPVAVAGRASNANITAMSATGDAVAALMTMIGALIVRPYSLPEADWSFVGTIVTNADTAVRAAGGIGIKQYVTAVQLQNTNAVATLFHIKDGTTIKHTVSLPASMAAPVDIEFPTPLQTTANAALNIACATTGANVLANLQGYTAP